MASKVLYSIIGVGLPEEVKYKLTPNRYAGCWIDLGIGLFTVLPCIIGHSMCGVPESLPTVKEGFCEKWENSSQ